MSLIPFPDVPQVAGVPALVRSSLTSSPVAKGVLGALQGSLWRSLNTQDNWGIFGKDGKKLVDIEMKFPIVQNLFASQISTGSVEYSKEMRVSEFPVEGGSFASYNKVEMSANAQVLLIVTGSEAQRAQVLNAIDVAVKTTDVYSIVTPEVVYVDYAIIKYDYRRSSENGATMLEIMLTLKEIRTVSSAYITIDKPLLSPNPTKPEDALSVPSGNTNVPLANAQETSLLKQLLEKAKGLF